MKRAAGFLLLQYQATRLTLDPTRGGAIREFTWQGQDFLRPAPATAGDDPFEMACFPMVPYVNRVARGRFTFAGREVRLERNCSVDPHPLHGQGWRAQWTVVAASKSSATEAIRRRRGRVAVALYGPTVLPTPGGRNVG